MLLICLLIIIYNIHTRYTFIHTHAHSSVTLYYAHTRVFNNVQTRYTFLYIHMHTRVLHYTMHTHLRKLMYIYVM